MACSTTISAEFMHVRLGDVRLDNRLMSIVEDFAASPGKTLPQKLRTPRKRVGAYRFFSSKRASLELVAAGHFDETVKRASAFASVLVPHDTTEFALGGDSHRANLGRLTENREGFLFHSSLCLSSEGKPLGSLNQLAWARGPAHGKKLSQQASQYNEDSESRRWFEAVEAVEERLAGVTSALHLMDREADSYELVAQLMQDNHRFVIRICHDRHLGPDAGITKLFEKLSLSPVIGGDNVLINARTHKRPKSHLKTHPARKARWAQLSFRALRAEICVGSGAVAHVPDAQTLNFVEVIERHPPDGTAPIHWRLMTTEPIETAEDVAAIINAYRHRWLIEEYFKAIKTGCNYESLQLESAHGLLLALAIYSAIAWRMLLLRWLAQHQPDAPAELVLSKTQFAALADICKSDGHPLPPHPNASTILFAVAGLAGHFKNNGPPGWLTLSRGFQALASFERGFLSRVPTEM